MFPMLNLNAFLKIERVKSKRCSSNRELNPGPLFPLQKGKIWSTVLVARLDITDESEDAE
jgi:hypothetical protein